MKYDNNVDAIIEKATVEIKGANSLNWLDRIRNDYLGINGIITRSIKSAVSLPESVRDERIASLKQAQVKLDRLFQKRIKELKMVSR